MSALSSVFDSKSIPQSLMDELRSMGFSCYNQDGNYIDLQFDVTYLEETRKHDRYSLNIEVSFHLEDNHVSVSLGTNLGDGFNSEYEIAYYDQNIKVPNIGCVLGILPDEPFKDTLLENPVAYQKLLTALSGFSKAFE